MSKIGLFHQTPIYCVQLYDTVSLCIPLVESIHKYLWGKSLLMTAARLFSLSMYRARPTGRKSSVNARARFTRVMDAASLKSFRWTALDVARCYSTVRHEAWQKRWSERAIRSAKRAPTTRGTFSATREARKIDRNFLHCHVSPACSRNDWPHRDEQPSVMKGQTAHYDCNLSRSAMMIAHYGKKVQMCVCTIYVRKMFNYMYVRGISRGSHGDFFSRLTEMSRWLINNKPQNTSRKCKNNFYSHLKPHHCEKNKFSWLICIIIIKTYI